MNKLKVLLLLSIIHLMTCCKRSTSVSIDKSQIGLSQLSQLSDKQELINFEFEGNQLYGVLDLPSRNVKGLVMIVHGAGRTNAIEQRLHLDVRKAILDAGYGTYMWDKAGCGKSGGIFDYNQTVQNSALEVIAAIKSLQQADIDGSESIGLWGISRAGWINPIVINDYKDIKFWISVSGVDDKESFGYLIKENIKIQGIPNDSVNLLYDELIEGYRLSHSGASYETYMKSTKNLRANKFLDRFNNGRITTKEGYYSYQKIFMKEAFDLESNLQIYVENFDEILSKIECPVLALFGEKDKHVDWNKTLELYKNTLGKKTDLTTASFPDCNHNIFKCNTGGFYEFEDDKLPWERCDDYLNTITSWIQSIE